MDCDPVGINFVNDPIDRLQPGDLEESEITWSDRIDELTDSRPFCFRLKIEAPQGASAAFLRYTPFYAMRDPKHWKREVRNLCDNFNIWTIDKQANSKRVATHVAMNKGQISVSLGAEEDIFLESMAKCLVVQQEMYFVELIKYEWPVPCFRLFVDLDFKQLKGITERGIQAAASVCAKTVHKFFSVPSKTIVTSTTYKEDSTTDSAGHKVMRIKTGVHLYWPKYYVTAMQALHIRESMIVDLNESFGNRCEPQQNTWEDVVDKSVYGDAASCKQGSGLRMVGNFKTAACKACKGRKAAAGTPKCDICRGIGNVKDVDINGRPGRPYMLLCVLKECSQSGPDGSGGHDAGDAADGGDGAAPDAAAKANSGPDRDTEQEDLYMGPGGLLQLLRDTKIRTEAQETDLDALCGFALPAGAPLYIGGPSKRPRIDGVVVKNQRRIEASDPLQLTVQALIREAFGALYNQVQVKQVTKSGKGTYFTATITGYNCRYCQNIAREHTSNNIYFVISKEGIAQRCFDDGPRTAEMRHGPCKDYVGGLLPIASEYMSLIWPETYQVAFGSAQIDQKKDSFFMRCLLNIGEFLSTQVYNVSWTSTLNLKPSGKGPLKDYLPQDPRDLGSKGIRAYKDLGLSWADALLDFTSEKHGIEDHTEGPKEPRKSMRSFEKDLSDAFVAIVTIACCVADPEIFTECECLDEFLVATESLKQAKKPDEESDCEIIDCLSPPKKQKIEIIEF